MKDNFFYISNPADHTWAFQDRASTEISNAYLITGQDRALLFDTGIGVGDIAAEVYERTNLPLTVVLSHGHHDHLGGAHLFPETWSWPSLLIESAYEQGISADRIRSYSGDEFFASLGQGEHTVKPFPKPKYFAGEDEIDLGGIRFQILHTPGHSFDSICLYEAEKKWLFSADTLYPGPIYLHLAESSVPDYIASVNRLARLAIDTIFPGHNTVLEPPELLSETLAVIDGRQSALYPRLKLITT